jgi:hypothetical protein
MIKRILGILIPLITCTALVAQETPIVNSGGYSKIIKGKEASFEKAVASHVAKWHGPDQWSTFAAIVMSGPRSGEYFMGTTNHYWKDYADRVMTKAHNDNWENLVYKHVEDQSGMMFLTKDSKASYNDRSAPMSEITWYYAKPGKRGKMVELLRKGAEAANKADYDGNYGVYRVVSGGKQNGILAIVTRMDSMADMAFTGPSNKEMWVNAYGEEVFNQAVKDWYDSFTKSQSEILRLIPEMTTPSN